MAMSDEDFADECIRRLNELLGDDEDVRYDVGSVLDVRVQCTWASAQNERMQCLVTASGRPLMGFLGVLNGAVGPIPDGPMMGLGFIAAQYDHHNTFVKFVRNDKP